MKDYYFLHQRGCRELYLSSLWKLFADEALDVMRAQPSSPCYSGGSPAFAGDVSLYYHVGKTPLAWPVHASEYTSEMGQNWSEPPILENGRFA
jgi:hypothetical protein